MLYYSAPELEAMFEQRGTVSGVAALGGKKSDEERSPFLHVVELTEDRLVILRDADPRELRPGALWSGPSLVTLVDGSAFLMAMAHLPPGSDALTMDLSMQFLRGAPFGELRAELRMLRMGKRAIVMSADVTSEAVPDGPVCHATTTFAPRLAGAPT